LRTITGTVGGASQRAGRRTFQHDLKVVSRDFSRVFSRTVVITSIARSSRTCCTSVTATFTSTTATATFTTTTATATSIPAASTLIHVAKHLPLETWVQQL